MNKTKKELKEIHKLLNTLYVHIIPNVIEKNKERTKLIYKKIKIVNKHINKDIKHDLVPNSKALCDIMEKIDIIDTNKQKEFLKRFKKFKVSLINVQNKVNDTLKDNEKSI
jgi:hypothetical protein